MVKQVIKPENLGSEFDQGVIEPSKIRLKLGAGLARLLDGSIMATATENKLAQISNGTAANSNNTAWTELPLTVSDFEDAGHFTKVGNGIRCDFAGRVKVIAHMSVTSAGARISPNMRLSSTGAINQNIQGRTGYMRNTAGHNETTLTIPGYITTVASGDIITIQSQRQGAAGTANTVIGGCYLLLERY